MLQNVKSESPQEAKGGCGVGIKKSQSGVGCREVAGRARSSALSLRATGGLASPLCWRPVYLLIRLQQGWTGFVLQLVVQSVEGA